MHDTATCSEQQLSTRGRSLPPVLSTQGSKYSPLCRHRHNSPSKPKDKASPLPGCLRAHHRHVVLYIAMQDAI